MSCTAPMRTSRSERGKSNVYRAGVSSGNRPGACAAAPSVKSRLGAPWVTTLIAPNVVSPRHCSSASTSGCRALDRLSRWANVDVAEVDRNGLHLHDPAVEGIRDEDIARSIHRQPLGIIQSAAHQGLA